MFDDLDQSLLLVAAIMVAFAVLLLVLTLLDPTTQRRPGNQAGSTDEDSRT